jgi:hypothetical protein
MNPNQRAYFQSKLEDTGKNDILREAAETLGCLAKKAQTTPILQTGASRERTAPLNFP